MPPAYLDYSAMVSHQFLERNEQFLQYRLIFDIRRTVHVALPAPTFFDFQAKRRYFITREEANEYERRTERLASKLQLVKQQLLHLRSTPNMTLDIRQASSGHRPTQSKSLSLGKYIFLTDITFMLAHSCQLSVLILFHCTIHSSLFSFLALFLCV